MITHAKMKLETRYNKYIDLGHVVCCRLASHFEYKSRAIFIDDVVGQTDERMDGHKTDALRL